MEDDHKAVEDEQWRMRSYNERMRKCEYSSLGSQCITCNVYNVRYFYFILFLDFLYNPTATTSKALQRFTLSWSRILVLFTALLGSRLPQSL